MSSLRNAVKRKTHKERAQPARRKSLGLLEKKKDYLERARDYQKKRDYVRLLEQKAAFRNPDEFYFKMVNSRTKNGVHQVEKEAGLSDDVQKLIRTQNLSYVQYHDTVESRRLEKLKENLHFLSDKPQNKHTVFLDDEEAGEKGEKFSKEEFFETTEEFADRAFNRPKREMLEKGKVFVNDSIDEDTLKTAVRQRKRAYKELQARLGKKKKLTQTIQHMELYKKLSTKGTRYKVKDGENGKPPVYKWKQERKR